MENKKVAIVTFQYSVVMKGIEKKLADEGFQVTVLSSGFDAVRNLAVDTTVFILYLSSDISKMMMLPNIIETISKAGRNIIFIGEKDDHGDISREFPAIEGYEWMDRPVDTAKLISMINSDITSGTEAQTKKRILIVDDDPAYAKMVREWIKYKYRTDIVTAGMQAITFLLKNKVDLILLDYEMPVVDGPQVLQMLRQEPVTANIPVVFLTGVGSKEGVARVLELKPDGYILKSTTRMDIINYLTKKLG